MEHTDLMRWAAMMTLRHGGGAEMAAQQKADEASKQGNTESCITWGAIAKIVGAIQEKKREHIAIP